MERSIRIAGEAGQGVQTTGNLLVGSLAKLGLYVFATQSYMSRIRGGLNWFDIRIADHPLYSDRERTDLLVALTEEARDILADQVADDGVVFFDGSVGDRAIAIDFTKTAKDLTGSAVMANTVAAGAVFAALGYDVQPLCDYLAGQFKKKGSEVIEQNQQCARRGAELAGERQAKLDGPEPDSAPEMVYSGSEAVGLSAAVSGVKFAASYPMTPSTGVFTYLAGAADRYGIVVEQAEDEIAAINMICSATYAGIPAMTTTSGGGFALMAEGLSLAGMMELPVVVLLSHRPGPATGLPTRTGQQDLLFALHAGHGEFPRAIFAPGTQGQCYELTRRALETAHRYQTPVILMIDQYLADQQRNMDALSDAYDPIDRCLAEDAGEDYVRYAVTDSGVSPRTIPGGPAVVVCDSDEHTADGHITEDLAIGTEQQAKRLRKLDGLTAEALAPDLYGPDDAEILLVAWGSTYGPAREAVDLLNADGGRAALLHFFQLWPIPRDAVAAQLQGRGRVVLVEGNHTAQLGTVLRQVGLIGEFETVLRHDGMPFTGDEIAREVAQ